MHDLADIADWMHTNAIHHACAVHDTLPDPIFRVNGQAAVSFSTNNYLALANHPRPPPSPWPPTRSTSPSRQPWSLPSFTKKPLEMPTSPRSA